MVHVRATHQRFHLAALVPPAFPMVCCRKCSFGFYGKATFVFTKDNDSHQRGIVLLQLKKRCAAFSSILLHSGHLESVNSTCLLLRLAFVGNLSLMSLHANNKFWRIFFFCSAKIDNYIICRVPGVLKIHMLKVYTAGP